jgi:hypothetical protein
MRVIDPFRVTQYEIIASAESAGNCGLW